MSGVYRYLRDDAPTGTKVLLLGIRQNIPCSALFTPGDQYGGALKNGPELAGDEAGADMQQRSAHENPVIFYSMVIGFFGPAMVLTVPPIRKSFGWKPAERIPTTFPLPNRPREAVSGYEDS